MSALTAPAAQRDHRRAQGGRETGPRPFTTKVTRADDDANLMGGKIGIEPGGISHRAGRISRELVGGVDHDVPVLVMPNVPRSACLALAGR